LKIYNTLTKSKEEFKPIHPGKVGMYVCGPTVYDYLHPGNLRSYMTADVLRRYLEYHGYEVRMIKNITDVGHLTEDSIGQGDSGEDKISKKAQIERKTPRQIADFFEEYFHAAEKKINIKKASFFPRATEHIQQMIKIISSLIEKGYAYEVNGNVFFDVTKFSTYGNLSGNTLDNLKVGARLEEHPDKKNPWDFALWLKAPKEHLMKWESPWSVGYPGWHIECSAMSMEYLGDTMDIHAGGEDNIFPHHEAEIAQSEGYSGKKFVNFWVHTRFLLTDGKKMSKSKGNFFTLEELEEKGYTSMALRLLFLSGHHRTQLNFTWPALDQATTNFQKISEWANNLKSIESRGAGSRVSMGEEIDFSHIYQKRFEAAMDDDLNTPLALAVLYELITETNKLIAEEKLSAATAKNIFNFWEKINKVLGLAIADREEIPKEIIKLAEARKTARENKDFAKSDELREKISEFGYEIDDSKNNNYTIKKK
ncbi:MAG: cysteine--tRNA ligase, partial [Candidatus Pacebacteria bacterium]|nr:cysteine--tRNA ligase [Candidatus Paceibacterota bacterium]